MTGGFEAWHVLMGAHAVLLEAIEREVAGAGGLALSWVEALTLLSDAPRQALRMQELASGLVLSKSGATRLVDRLVAEKLIERTSCGEDRRGVYAALTEQGRAALEQTRPLLIDAVDKVFSRHLTAHEANQLRVLLDKVAAANGYQVHSYGETAAG